MAFRRADASLDHREVGDAQRRHIAGALDQHGDIEMILEQMAASIARSSLP